MSDGQDALTMEAHLFVSLSECLEVSVEVHGESLPTGLLFIPMLHAYVPRVPVIIIYAATGCTHLMEFASEGIASVGVEDFCFLADVEDTMSSGFLFFLSIAIACSSCKLRGAAFGGVVAGSCAGLCSVVVPRAGRGALCTVLPSLGAFPFA